MKNKNSVEFQKEKIWSCFQTAVRNDFANCEKKEKKYMIKKITVKKTEVENWGKCRYKFSANCAILSGLQKYWKKNHKTIAMTCERTPNEQEANRSGARGNEELQLGQERRNSNRKTNSEENSWFARVRKGKNSSRYRIWFNFNGSIGCQKEHLKRGEQRRIVNKRVAASAPPRFAHSSHLLAAHWASSRRSLNLSWS